MNFFSTMEFFLKPMPQGHLLEFLLSLPEADIFWISWPHYPGQTFSGFLVLTCLFSSSSYPRQTCWIPCSHHPRKTFARFLALITQGRYLLDSLSTILKVLPDILSSLHKADFCWITCPHYPRQTFAGFLCKCWNCGL